MKIPLVDLSLQHDQIADVVQSGIDGLFEHTQFVLGPEVEEFEKDFSDFMGVGHSIAVGSGTDALEIAVRSLGLGPGDEVIVPANSFIASALAVLRAGASVVLVDCEPEFHLLDASVALDAMSPTVRAVMPVHLYGQMADVPSMRAATGVFIIEDAAQAHGAVRDSIKAGSAGDIAGTSFFPGKNLGAYGDGGAVLTDNVDLADSARAMRNWGSEEKYQHPVLGFNSRLDSIQAVVLKAKLSHLAEWNRQRRQAAANYSNLLADVEQVACPKVAPGSEPVWHLYVVRVGDRDRVIRKLQEAGIGAGIHYPVPIHLQGAMSDLGHGVGDFPNTERASQEIISLPIFPGISEDQQLFVVERLKEAVGA